jgi:quinoprotein glucose dehydrogenase
MAIGSPTPTSVAAGVYEAAQATRGSAAYAEACSACHAADLRGDSNAPSLVGVSFLFVWENRSLDELFTTIRTRMPTNAPNSLQATTYLDVLAYILEANGFPAGEAEITADPDRLARILITGA